MTSATRKRKAKEQIEEPRQSKAPPKRRKNTAVARTSDRATIELLDFDYSIYQSLLNAAQKRKLCNVYIRAIVDFSLREIQDDTKRSRKKIFTSTVDGLKHVKNLVLDVTYDIVLDAWGPTPDELELARAAVDCLRPLQAISLKQVTVHLGENFPGLGSDYNYPGQAENPEISGIAQELRSALLNENGAKLAAKARERKKPVWTEGNIRKDYQKTESLCRAVFKNARREINRYPGDRRRAIQMFLAMEKAAPRQQYRGLASSLWNVNDPVYPLKYAIVRVAKWQLTERKKRELCNKRLSKFSGAKMIEDPQYEGLEAYGENSSHEGLASVVCEETPDFDDPVEDMSSVEDEDSGIDEKAE
ncbi:uncharacterized protein KY384_008863 [Bacidia gigantensis]|uniref:uncharacterized protein n=1 Tax=Bacidia gigantensis TaxID=2732470 RepID=UPI001D0559FA|nr:uncharacterized protein KY384_008863 [Bacidia gigantensis]KAG8525219.1 hypothetical protein KY384_008863 [Bacidia gigantensis]